MVQAARAIEKAPSRRTHLPRSTPSCRVEDVAGASQHGSPLSSLGCMRTHGWPYPFRQRPWDEIDAFLRDVAGRHVEFRHMADVVKSVLASDQTGALAACTSMRDLIVVPTPVPSRLTAWLWCVLRARSASQPRALCASSTSLRRATTMPSTGLWLMRFRCFGGS